MQRRVPGPQCTLGVTATSSDEGGSTGLRCEHSIVLTNPPGRGRSRSDGPSRTRPAAAPTSSCSRRRSSATVFTCCSSSGAWWPCDVDRTLMVYKCPCQFTQQHQEHPPVGAPTSRRSQQDSAVHPSAPRAPTSQRTTNRRSQQDSAQTVTSPRPKAVSQWRVRKAVSPWRVRAHKTTHQSAFPQAEVPLPSEPCVRCTSDQRLKVRSLQRRRWWRWDVVVVVTMVAGQARARGGGGGGATTSCGWDGGAAAGHWQARARRGASERAAATAAVGPGWGSGGGVRARGGGGRLWVLVTCRGADEP